MVILVYITVIVVDIVTFVAHLLNLLLSLGIAFVTYDLSFIIFTHALVFNIVVVVIVDFIIINVVAIVR